MAKNNIVGKAKSSFVLLMSVILAGSAGIVGVTSITNSAERKQAALIQQAEPLLADGLYVRAAAGYKEALSRYQTKNNAQIEENLLSLYRDGGMIAEYTALMESRVSGGRASAEEYIELANGYLANGSELSAVKLLVQGAAAYPENAELIELFESLKYAVRGISLDCEIAKNPISDWLIPVSDGEKWGYMTSDARMEDFLYEEATPYSGNYAVVKMDGAYALIDRSGYKNAIDKNGIDTVTQLYKTRLIGETGGSYSIYTNDFTKLSTETYDDAICAGDNLYFVKKNGKWALLGGDLKPITDYIYTDVCRNSAGIVFYENYGVVADEQGYYLIRPDGKEWFSARFAGAKGIESGLVAVSDERGTWGFIDEKGEYVVEPAFADAGSFSSQLAPVKVGEKWGYVNKYGVIQIQPVYQEAHPFLENAALVKDEHGIYKVLKLKYYSTYKK